MAPKIDNDGKFTFALNGTSFDKAHPEKTASFTPAKFDPSDLQGKEL